MPRTKPDRRVARTQHSLHQALNTLILKKGYEAISIKDIVAHADVGRSTFYAHHGSKEGLLVSGLEHLRFALMGQQREKLSGSGESGALPLAFSLTFFEHVREYRDILQALLANEGDTVVTRKMKRLLADVVRSELCSFKVQSGTGGVPRDALVQFTVDALFSILLWWFERSPSLPPAEADAIFRRLAVPALAAAGVS